MGLGILVFKKNASHVYFVDCVPHIMKQLQLRIDGLRVPPQIPHTLLCLKGEDIEQDIRGVVLIAGVGGLTISKILKSLMEKNRLKAKRLILSPHTDIKVLEEYLSSLKFKKCYDLSHTLKVIVGKKEKPLFIFDAIGDLP